ncbi:MAG TPA: hypothetical protein VIC26_04970 [Marinagarivorans sp.]
MKYPLTLAIAHSLVLLTGCGSSSNKASESPTASSSAASSPAESSSSAAASSSSASATEATFVSALSTGSFRAPKTAYYDLDAGKVVELTEDEAADNTEWDISFNRTTVALNTHVKLYYTGNAAAFYSDGEPLVAEFESPDIDSINEAFAAFNGSAIANDIEFNGDETANAIDGFYIYNFADHSATANPEAYFIVQSDNGSAEAATTSFSKFNVVNLTQAGFGMTDITLSISNQAADATEFNQPQELYISAIDCTDDIFIDLDTRAITTSDADWELNIPCADGSASFDINLADGDTALTGTSAKIDAVDMAGEQAYETWYANEYTVHAIVEHGHTGTGYGWGEYGLIESAAGTPLLAPNFATFVIKTDTNNYKFQVVDYYNSEQQSGYYSFRFAPITLP